MDGKNFGIEQQAQQKKPDAVTDSFQSPDQETLKQFADSDAGNTAQINGHEADVNMEAAISTEDVMRAGGFGAKDDICSLLPTAIDSTDFEASLRDARDFEGEKEAPARPGLGWKGKGMDGKNFGIEQQTQQKKPDAVIDSFRSPDQETLKQFADSDAGNAAQINGHEADVNMEASISTEDVMRAGGFGAKDDICSLLPTAIDSTDFEASLQDALDFEGEKEAPAHPGLGWKGEKADDGSKPSDMLQQ